MATTYIYVSFQIDEEHADSARTFTQDYFRALRLRYRIERSYHEEALYTLSDEAPVDILVRFHAPEDIKFGRGRLLRIASDFSKAVKSAYESSGDFSIAIG